MKKKSKILILKKFTIASLRAQYRIVGAGNTNEPNCINTVDPNVCETVNRAVCASDPAVCKTDEPSCLSSDTQTISNARGVCASHIGGGD
jgi:hypothetical protein